MRTEFISPHTSLAMDPVLARSLLAAQYGYFCFRCGKVPTSYDRQLTVDHIVPRALGGCHVYANYQLLCSTCNGVKHMRVADYRPGTRQLDVIGPRERIYLNEGFEVDSEASYEHGYRWVSFSEAMKMLGMGEGTLRRAIKAGTVQAEAEPREPGTGRIRYLVRIPGPAPANSDVAPEAPSAIQPPTDPPLAITGLLGLVAAEREERQRLVSENADLRERIGRAEAERDAAEKRLAERPWWRKVWGS